MRRNFVLAAVLIMILNTVPSFAEENRLLKGLWVEGGSTPNGNFSIAVGTRIGPIGMKFGYGGDYDYKGSDVYNAYPFQLSDLGVAAKSLGKKTIDPAFGWDFGYFYDFSKNFTGYAEVGTYWQEQREVLEVTQSLRLMAWDPGTKFNIEKNHYLLTIEGGAGLQYRIPYEWGRAVLLTVGYHTMRGISGGIGLAY